jgi:hypothetical protein
MFAHDTAYKDTCGKHDKNEYVQNKTKMKKFYSGEKCAKGLITGSQLVTKGGGSCVLTTYTILLLFVFVAQV